MKETFNNLLNAATTSIQNAQQNAADRIAVRRAAESAPKSPEVARIEQETQLQTAKMTMSMLKKLLIAGAIITVLPIGGILAFGVYTMNKFDSRIEKNDQSNERMINNALDRLQFGL